MKTIIAQLALLAVVGATIATAVKADGASCCKPGAKCCAPGAPCCPKK